MMSADYVRRYYGVDYKRGDRVRANGRPGTIVSFPESYLGVRLDGEKHTRRWHPTDEEIERIEQDPTTTLLGPRPQGDER